VRGAKQADLAETVAVAIEVLQLVRGQKDLRGKERKDDEQEPPVDATGRVHGAGRSLERRWGCWREML